MKNKTNRTLRKILSIALCLSLVMSYVPMVSITASAAETCICTTKCVEGSVNGECTVCSTDGAELSACAGSYTYDEATNTYIIYNKAGLDAWRTAATSDVSTNLTLACDIEYNASWSMLDITYSGTIDGKGYAIVGLNCSDTSEASFISVLGSEGVIKHLGMVGGSFSNSQSSLGDGSAAFLQGNKGIIMGCYNTSSCTSAGNSDDYGRASGISYGNAGKVVACYNAGTISAGGDFGSGICGSNGGVISGCYNTGAVSGKGASYGYIASAITSKNTKTINDCYYTQPSTGYENYDSGIATNITKVTGSDWTAAMNAMNAAIEAYNADESNTVKCNYRYIINKESDTKANQPLVLVCQHIADEPEWISNQNGTHSANCDTCDLTYTISCSGGTATCTTRAVCEACGSSYGEVDKTNHDETVASDEYTNGFCQHCGGYQNPDVNPGEDPEWEYDDIYLVENAGQLFWIANYVNNVSNEINVLLTTDITIPEGKEWTPIMNFYGTFDGGYYTVSGLDASGDEFVGMFGGGSYAYGTIKNLHITNSRFEGTSYVGALAGYHAGNIYNCYVDSSVTVTGDSSTGLLVGHNAGAVQNCYAYGSSCVGYYDGNYSTVENCYYLSETETEDGGKTAEQFESGEVAYLLQQGNTEQVWGQDNNQAGAKPMFTSNELYKVVTVGETGNYSVANVGDTNGDGTVDVTDYQALVNMAVSEGHSQTETASYDDIVKYDLDGDGYLDVIDAYLLHLFINGFTTVDVYAVGDYDLNGKAFEEADIKAIKHAIENPEKLATYKKYASDINGDGKLDENDLTALTAKYSEVTGTECADNVKVYYRWGNKYSTCTATAMCTLCGKKVATETVNTTSETLSESTCTQDGKVKYTATFQNELFEERIKTVTTDMLPHNLSDGVCTVCGIIDATAMSTEDLNVAVSTALAAGHTDIEVGLAPDAPAEMITAIRRAICDTEGVADGSINLTLKGVTTIPGTTNWDGVAFGPRNAQWDENNVEIVSHEEVTQLASVNLPDVTEIGAQAFLDCSNLTSITAPKVQSIGDWGLQGTAITSIDMPLLKEARYSAFCRTALTEVSLPSLETAGVIVFGHCKQLRTVDLPKLQNLSQQLFTRCTSLVAVNAPAATSMGNNVFKGCSELVSITLPGVTELTYEAFAECTKLENITLGSVITNVNVNLFAGEALFSNITLTLSCGQENAEILPVTAGSNVAWAGFTWKEVKFAHSYVDGKCTACGEDCAHTGEATYTLTEDGKQHIAKWSCCDKEVTEDHTGGTATCKEPAKCEHCDASYGELDPNNHEYEKNNGICCETYQPAELNESGYYEIGNAGQLFWFAQQVNVEGNKEIRGALTADIDLENKPWTPIGAMGEENSFRGVFDGQNYTIRGLNVEGSENGVGFFGEVRTGTVKNFTIYGEVIVNTEVDYVGGVIGSICGLDSENDLERNGAVIQNITSYVNVTANAHGIGMIGGFVGYADHQSLIEKCSWYGTFDAGEYRVDSGAGGFIGKIQENTSEVTIRNCGAYGTIKTNYAKNSYNNTATIYMGGFLSFSNTGAKTTLENCLFAGRFERGENLTDEARLGAFGTLRSVNAIKNCYYLGDDGLEAVHSDSDLKPGSDNVEITKVTEDDLRNNTITTQLGEYWAQGEHYPVIKR